MGLIGTPGRIDNVVVENSMPLLIREGTSKFFITKMDVCQKSSDSDQELSYTKA